MSGQRQVWIELTGTSMDGKVWRCQQAPAVRRLADDVFVPLVATGSVRWVDECPVEVWVPEGRLDLWRAEHDVEVS